MLVIYLPDANVSAWTSVEVRRQLFRLLPPEMRGDFRLCRKGRKPNNQKPPMRGLFRCPRSALTKESNAGRENPPGAEPDCWLLWRAKPMMSRDGISGPVGEQEVKPLPQETKNEVKIVRVRIRYKSPFTCWH